MSKRGGGPGQGGNGGDRHKAQQPPHNSRYPGPGQVGTSATAQVAYHDSRSYGHSREDNYDNYGPYSGPPGQSHSPPRSQYHPAPYDHDPRYDRYGDRKQDAETYRGSSGYEDHSRKDNYPPPRHHNQYPPHHPPYQPPHQRYDYSDRPRDNSYHSEQEGHGWKPGPPYHHQDHHNRSFHYDNYEDSAYSGAHADSYGPSSSKRSDGYGNRHYQEIQAPFSHGNPNSFNRSHSPPPRPMDHYDAAPRKPDRYGPPNNHHNNNQNHDTNGPLSHYDRNQQSDYRSYRRDNLNQSGGDLKAKDSGQRLFQPKDFQPDHAVGHIAPLQFPSVELPTNIKLLPQLVPGHTNTLSSLARITTNSYPVDLDATLLHSVFQYSVSFEPEVPSSHIKRKLFYNAILLCQETSLEWVSFDGQAMAYSFLPLPNQVIDTNEQITALVNQKLLYDEFGTLIDAPPTGPTTKISIIRTNHCNIGAALEKIKKSIVGDAAQLRGTSLEVKEDQLISTDHVRERSDLTAFVNLSLSTLFRHCSVVYAVHGERNRVREKINPDPQFWKSNPNIRILLSIEGFVARNGSVYRLDRPNYYSQKSCLGKAVYAVPAAFSALRFLQTGITFNVAQSSLPTYQLGRPLLAILEEINGGDLTRAPESVYRHLLKYRAITHHLPPGKNQRISLQTVGPRLFDCKGFTIVENGVEKQISIQNYFLDKYNLTLKNYYTYVLIRRTPAHTDPVTKKFTPASEQQLVYPIEILSLYSVSNQGVRDLDGQQTKTLLNLMTRRPHESLQAASEQLKDLQTALNYIKQQTSGSAPLAAPNEPRYINQSIYSGISLSVNEMHATARVLPPPQAEFGDNKTLMAQGGEFKTRDIKLVEPASDKTGPISAVVCSLSSRVGRDTALVMTYAHRLVDAAQRRGLDIRLDDEERLFVQTNYNNHTAQELEKWARYIHSKGVRNHRTYLVIAVTDPNSDFYNCLKRVGDSQIALPTQCANWDKIRNTFGSTHRAPSDAAISSYVGNIVLKLNCKLGGLNYRLKPAAVEHNPLLTKQPPPPHPTISAAAPLAVFGIDIYHNPGSRSHAGVVGTYDKSCSKYNGYLVQQPKNSRPNSRKGEKSVEVIDPTTIQRAFTTLLLQFSAQQPSPSLPQQIVVYRDGLSESQIPLSMDSEIPGIVAATQQAYLTLFPTSTYTYKPTITYLIAVKRHQIFFKPRQGEDDFMSKDKSGRERRTENVRAGTVVDTTIVRNDITEFYLQAHASALGTGKCTLYQVVYCSEPASAKLDDLQLLTNYLSYGIQRATKATRVPSPISHADLVCYRGRSYVNPGSNDGTWSVEEMPSDLAGRHYWL